MAEPRLILQWVARKKKPWREAMWDRAAKADAGLPTADGFHALFHADVDVVVIVHVDAGGQQPWFRLETKAAEPHEERGVHFVLLSAPVTYFGELDEVQREVALMATFDAMLAAYCTWRRWDLPPSLPLTEPEAAWVQANGPFEVPEWARRMRLPRRTRGDVDRVRLLLRGADLDDRFGVITEAAEDATSTAEIRRIVGGWCSLVADLGTDHCWDDAHRETGWFMTESVFHDLRSWAVLVDPDVTASTFGALLRHIEDEEDVGEAGCITETLLGIAEEYDVGQGDFLDPWGVATQR